MKITKELIDEAVRIDMNLWKNYTALSEQKIESAPHDYMAILWLEADLGAVATKYDDEKFDDVVKEIIDSSPLSEQIKEAVNLPAIKKLAAIKKNWKVALEIVDSGSDLSSFIKWAFTSEDLCNLAKLHQNSNDEMKKKIENLLTDCNFHSECGDFSEGNYDKYITKNLITQIETDLGFLEEYKKIRELSDKLKISWIEAKELYDNSWDDRDNEWSVVYGSYEDLGRHEFESIGIDNWVSDYFDFDGFGRDVANRDNTIFVLSSGKLVSR